VEEVVFGFLRFFGGLIFELLVYLFIEFGLYKLCYYIGVVPVYALTLGKKPCGRPWALKKKEREPYAVFGACVLLSAFIAMLVVLSL